MKNLIFVDCEATGPCPGKGVLTEFGAVEYSSRQTFHGILFESRPKAENPALSELTGEAFDPVEVFTQFEEWLKSVTSGRAIFVSDNPAYDFQWINYGFHHTLGRNIPLATPDDASAPSTPGSLATSATRRPGSGCASRPTTTIRSATRWATWKRSSDC